MAKPMSVKKFRTLVLFLDLTFIGAMILFLTLPKTQNFIITNVIERDSWYEIIWGLPAIALFGLTWQVFDERYADEKKRGVYKKNQAKREKQNKQIKKYFNLTSILNLFFIGFQIYALFNNIAIPFADMLGILSFMLFVASLSFWIAKLLTIKK